MTSSSRAGWLALAIVLILPATPGFAADPPASDQAARQGGWAPPEFRLDAGLRIGHTDNLFHAQAGNEAEFDTQTGPYQRYAGMKGPGDTEVRLGLDLAWRFKHASKRAIGLRLRSRQFAYLDNEIANHENFRLDAIFDVSKVDRLRLWTDYSPEHFRKNLKHEAFPGISIYERADAREKALGLEYEREWSKAWSTTISLGQARRDYATPFNGRDEDRDSWSLAMRHQLTKRVGLELSFERESTGTPTSVEVGVPKDRSHDDDVAALGIDLNLRRGWAVRQSSTYRVREFTTSETLDTSRYGRTDRRWIFELDVEKKLKGHWTLAFDGTWTQNDAGRQEAGIDDDDFDFTEFAIGAAVSFRR